MFQVIVDRSGAIVETPDHQLLYFRLDRVHNSLVDENGQHYRLDGGRPVPVRGIPPVHWTVAPAPMYH